MLSVDTVVDQEFMNDLKQNNYSRIPIYYGDR